MVKLTLAGIVYPSADAAKAFLRDKMNSYVLHAPIPAADVALWFEVLQKHEWFAEYVEHGIDHISVAPSEQQPHLRNMVVVNSAGEQKAFSFLKYLTRGALPRMARIMAALRTEVDDQITAFRAGRGGHVHHTGKPFIQIVDEFLVFNANRWWQMDTESAGATGYRLRDRVIAAAWSDYHRAVAVLAMTTPQQNLSLGASGYKMRFVEPALPPPPY